MKGLKTHRTPNPDAMKFTSSEGPFLQDGLESFSSADQARGHPLGEAVMAVDGVANVLILPEFLTVTKTPSARWAALLPHLETAIAGALAAGRP